MCGIAGIADTDNASISVMLDAISHRGPDDQGVWQATPTKLSLGHRRLSIVDLSSAGHQPMISHSNRYVLTYNGEIYNYRVLKKEIEKLKPSMKWMGNSDTEVLLAGIEAWGLKDCLKKIDGMFALALFDTQRKTLTLARDRFGEKPVFFCWTDNKFAFASQLNALEALPNFDKSINPDSVKQHLHLGYCKGMNTFYKTTHRLPAGHCIELDETNFFTELDKIQIFNKLFTYLPTIQPYKSSRNIVDTIQERLESNVKDRLVADVPVGVFLSGGIDSSLITAISKKQINSIQTFTIGFQNQSYDESPYAERIAEYLKTDHHTLYIREEDVLARILGLNGIVDEPFGDTSIIPTSFLCEFSQKKVKVALTGDGGDELFGGYSRYIIGSNISKFWSLLPNNARQKYIGIDNFLFKNRNTILRQKILPTAMAVKAHRMLHRLSAVNARKMDESFIGANSLSTSLYQSWSDEDIYEKFNTEEIIQKMMCHDQSTYLPDNILVKADRSSMAFGLETRAPFLSTSLLEISIQLKNNQLIKNGEGKILLRKLLGKYLPNHLFDRPKSGFSPPFGQWLRGPLNSWANELLSAENLRDIPGVDADYAKGIWSAHCKGSIDAAFSLWPLLSYATWFKNRRGTF